MFLAIQSQVKAILFCVPLSAILCVPAQAQDVNSAKCLQVLTSLKKRQAQLNPVWIQYNCLGSESLAFRRFSLPSATKGGTWNLHCQFANKGAKHRTSGNGKDDRVPNLERNVLKVYNGKIQITNGANANQYVASATPTRNSVIETPDTLSGESWLIESLEDLFEKPKKQYKGFRATWKQLDDPQNPIQLLRLESADKSWSCDCWLLQDAGYAPNRIETRTNGKLTVSHQVDEFLSVDGFTYPKKGRRTVFASDGVSVNMLQEFEVLSFETNPSRIPDSLFDCELPQGSLLWDEDEKVFIRDFELTQSHLDEVVRLVGDRRYLWRRWGMIGGGFVVTVVLVGLLWYWRRRKGAPVRSTPK